jgi:protein involved in plasmid replication-relaxation
MQPPGKRHKAWDKIIGALSEFDYLTADQLTRLLYAPSSLKYVQELLKALRDASLVTAVGGKAVNLPRLYTLSGMGRQYASVLGAPKTRRFRPSEEAEKGQNPYFLKHTMAVTDVLISARLLSQTHPAITLSRMVTERELRRRIYVDIPEKLCIEPDASCEFLITENGHNGQQTRTRDFFHIEVYRNLPPVERRFKQKIAGYVTYVDTGQHQALFNTSALSIAVIAIAKPMAITLKRWTEAALQEMGRPEEGEWFFFCSLDVAKASPREMFLTPVWEQAFRTDKTPLIMLE